MGDPDVIRLGDYNADGSYFDEEELVTVFPASGFILIIDDAADTTITASSNTYDRIISRRAEAEDYAGELGVFRFDQVYDFGLLSIVPGDVSDHYHVWAVFGPSIQMSLFVE